MREQLAPAAAMFHGLSDPTRLAILQHWQDRSTVFAT